MADEYSSIEMEVVGFWLRVRAAAIDTLLILAVTFSFLLFVYGKPSDTQLIIRYFAYFISMIPLFLGFFWVAFDEQNLA